MARDVRRADARTGRRRLRLACAVLAGALLAALIATSALAADLTLTARPLLGGHARAGAWVAVDVEVANDGPRVTGELRVTGDRQGRSTYGVAVDLATGSRQRHTLYAQPSIVGRELRVALVAGSQTIASHAVPITQHEANEPIVAVVAERPQGLVPDLSVATTLGSVTKPSFLTLTPADLPARPEAWSAIDALVWQDTDAVLSDGQRAALDAWLTRGGRLVIAGGTTGVTTLAGFPEHLLPFRPSLTVDVARADLTPLLGTIPDAPATVPAVAGTLERGAVLVRSGEHVAAAESSHGQGSVSLIGFDPAQRWLAGSEAARTLWRRLLPVAATSGDPLIPVDDSPFVGALSNLPATDLPPVGGLLVLLGGYIALVGPLNYLVLRRLDRREWAWFTMPVLVGVFAVASYSLGVVLKGTDVIVNEVAVVRAAPGSEAATGHVYVGIFSPSRQRFEVHVGGDALLSNPLSQQQAGAFEQPLDVLLGQPARLRDYQVGFGAVRGFRAEATTEAPLIEADLRYSDGRLEGAVTNRSTTRLESPAVVLGTDLALLRSLEPGETHRIDLRVSTGGRFALPLADRLFGSSYPSDPAAIRTRQTRETVVRAISGYGSEFGGGATATFGATPTLLAWRPGPVLDVALAGQPAKHVGETLYVISLPADVSGTLVISDSLIRESVLEGGNMFGEDVPSRMHNLSHGTMVAEYRPVGITGSIRPTSLRIAMSHGEPAATLGTQETPIEPLPADRQPDPDDPLGGLNPGQDFEAFPALQLFDRTTGRWVEFPPLEEADVVEISRPERYVDASGAVVARFVNRNVETFFTVAVAITGTVE